ncbi:unnamed protein product [Thelazia callipaeda]|uniref:TIR domain-containing protein n=1 Tax=Thelazia callipaeda TaxID=103827 RepID=A0A0N5CXI2_THECL|nr:unnamed protein product [Thelazia callipaeda]
MDISESQSVTLDIELDSGRYSTAGISGQGSKKSSLFSFNNPPPHAWDLVPQIPRSITITALPKRGLQEMELCLNLRSRGSMLNWEYVAAAFGFSNNKIMHLRTSSNPTADVLREIAGHPLKSLLDALAKINRVDALLSLQPYIESAVSSGGKSETPSTDSVILVTHHELDTHIAVRNNFRWFFKNLRKRAKQSGFLAVNIDDCMETSCEFEGLHALFANASSIVCVFTDDYVELLKSKRNEQTVMVKQYLHKLMNSEFLERGENKRFRAVIFQGTGRDLLPLGWAKSTLVYEFPANHLQLFQRLFA